MTAPTAQSTAADLVRSAGLAWIAAEDAWQAELVRVWKDRAAEARYDARGSATPRLRRLHAAYDTHRIRWVGVLDAYRALHHLGPTNALRAAS